VNPTRRGELEGLMQTGHRMTDTRLATFQAAIRHRSRNINALHEEQLTLGERLADRIASVVGSWPFIIAQSIALAIWIVLNVAAWIRHWDPYPFILLNLALSFQAAYSAPIIMMSQNRQAAKDRLKAEEDFHVNVQAEQEIAALHARLEHLTRERWDDLCAMQEAQITLLRAITTMVEQTDERRNPPQPHAR
jgi:uncharacterized membrane protein